MNVYGVIILKIAVVTDSTAVISDEMKQNTHSKGLKNTSDYRW